jgi:hypothetical protein
MKTARKIKTTDLIPISLYPKYVVQKGVTHSTWEIFVGNVID